MPGNLQRTLKNTKQRLKKKPPDILSIFNSSDWLQTIYCNINWLLFGVFPLKFLQTCLNRFLSFFKFEMSRYLWLLLVLGPHLALTLGSETWGTIMWYWELKLCWLCTRQHPTCCTIARVQDFFKKHDFSQILSWRVRLPFKRNVFILELSYYLTYLCSIYFLHTKMAQSK